MTDQTQITYDPASGADPTPEQAAALSFAEADVLDTLRPGWDERVKQVIDFRQAQAAREAKQAKEAEQAAFEERFATDANFREDYGRHQVAERLHDEYWSFSVHERLRMAEEAGRYLRLDTRERDDLDQLVDRLRPAPAHYLQNNDLSVFKLHGRDVILAS